MVIIWWWCCWSRTKMILLNQFSWNRVDHTLPLVTTEHTLQWEPRDWNEQSLINQWTSYCLHTQNSRKDAFHTFNWNHSQISTSPCTRPEDAQQLYEHAKEFANFGMIYCRVNILENRISIYVHLCGVGLFHTYAANHHQRGRTRFKLICLPQVNVTKAVTGDCHKTNH